MLLTMRKGQEHHLVINQRLDDPNELMYSAYRQALEALDEIVRQAREFQSSYKTGYKTNGDSKLYGYAHNIIAFSGSRGQGKTSAMLSFSDAMRACSQEYRKLPHGLPGDCSFTVLQPFDPTILEENQSILAVVLSRMYRLAEEEWRSPNCGRSEADKNDLLDMFQQCLSGINAIKFRKGEEIKTLHSIHEISDSSLLKDNFYQLTDRLLRFINGGARANSFLVIQLDDTDFQIRKGYEILEDIRKYLTLPNVIILMATDLDMLRHALTQHYINEFTPGLSRGILDINDLRKLESKYLDKLIPPTFAVYLPHLDDMIRQRNELVQLAYIDPREEAEAARRQQPPANLLLKQGWPCRTEDFSFQALLLRYIYRKTRIVFAEHANYLHNLIPTTLRGLAQLLGLLLSMDDVQEIDRDDPRLNDSHALAEMVRKQVDVLEVNLPLFENYFLNDWVHTKLPKEKMAVIEQLSGALPEQRCRLAVELLEKLYNEHCRENSTDYVKMICLLEDLKEAHRQTEDFYFLFAVHTFFTIQAHKALVRQKRRAVQAFFAEEKEHPNEKPLLIFDFSPESTDMPVWFDIPELPEQMGDYRMKCELREPELGALKSAVGSDYAGSLLLREEKPQFSVLYFIGLFMSLGSAEGKKLAVGELDQKDLYLAQTSAATIAINWDVQDRLRKLPAEAFKENSGDNVPKYSSALRMVWNAVDTAIESINACKLPGNPCPMITSCSENMINFIGGDAGLQRALRAIDTHFGEDYLAEICGIYNYTQQLRRCVQQEADNLGKIIALFNGLVDVCRTVSPEVREQFGMKLLSDRLDAFLNAGTSAAKGAFTKTVNAELKSLCEKFGYTTAQVEDAVKNIEVR